MRISNYAGVLTAKEFVLECELGGPAILNYLGVDDNLQSLLRRLTDDEVKQYDVVDPERYRVLVAAGRPYFVRVRLPQYEVQQAGYVEQSSQD